MELVFKLWIISIWVVAGIGYYKGRSFGNLHGILDAIIYSCGYVFLSICIVGSLLILVTN